MISPGELRLFRHVAQVHGARSGAGHFWSWLLPPKSRAMLGYLGLSGRHPSNFLIYIHIIYIYIIYIYIYLSGYIFFWVTVDQTGVQVGWMSGNVSRSAKGPEGKTVLTTFEPNRDGGLSGSGFHMVPRYPLILFWKLHGMPSVLDTSASSLHFVIDYFHSRGILDNKPTILGWFLQPCMVLMIHENMALPQAPSHR